ncbi:glycoside hydrolase family 15 protein [Catenulispora subtropica]|uniref:Glycoside hydrolase family 15 protein n=1 Tax=Catenulispora subtropica TaxID=450798 RepID=A0ABP5EHU6_9ACTN
MTSHAYPAIDDHALLGDLRTCALVTGDGTVDWFCPGRFDAPSVFGALLDDAVGGGAFRVWSEGASASLAYIPDTAVAVTRFVAADGAVGEVVDFMVPDESSADDGRTLLYRIVRGVEGRIRFTMYCHPRFDYGREEAREPVLERRGTAHAAVFEGSQTSLTLFGTVPMVTVGEAAAAQLELFAGQAAVFLVAASAPGDWVPDVEHEAERSLAETLAFWLGWVAKSGYRGRWPDAVHRSAITLKLLTHAPTGAIVAAATTALPEQIGGPRNWDYRYTWIRDGSFSARALLDLGYRDEAEAFARWVTARLAEGPTRLGEPLDIMYRVDGTSDLIEEELPQWRGYMSSSPVRIGNGAAEQLQLDIYGEFLYSLGGTEHLRSPEGQAAVAKLLDWLVENWARPDEGIWETRGGRRDFTYSRLMCWAAFEYGLRIAPTQENAGMWAVMAHAIADEIRLKGWDEKQGSYVQSYGDPALDASLLLMPVVGFTSPEDPRWHATLTAIEQGLTHDGLCHRYRVDDFSDGLEGDESSFDLCTTLYHTALAGSGEVERARKMFMDFLGHAGPTGLFAEELTPEGEQLGNFPQAFTHLGVIWTALALDTALDAVDTVDAVPDARI